MSNIRCVRSAHTYRDKASGRVKTTYTFILYDTSVEPWYLIDSMIWDCPIPPSNFGRCNIFIGHQAGLQITTGDNNICISY